MILYMLYKITCDELPYLHVYQQFMGQVNVNITKGQFRLKVY